MACLLGVYAYELPERITGGIGGVRLERISEEPASFRRGHARHIRIQGDVPLFLRRQAGTPGGGLHNQRKVPLAAFLRQAGNVLLVIRLRLNASVAEYQQRLDGVGAQPGRRLRPSSMTKAQRMVQM